MTRVIDQVRTWRTEAADGPEPWQDALDRTLELVTPLWGDKELVWDGPMLAHGGVALALALYILAREQGIPVRQVTRQQVEQLHSDWRQRVVQWQRRLDALGVALTDPADPIALWWRTLSFDDTPEGGIDIDEWELGANPGPLLNTGLDFVLAPMWRLEF